MGILEALKSDEISAEKKDAFYAAGVNLGTSSGLNEIYSIDDLKTGISSTRNPGLANVFYRL
ncbi:MAG: hypothetical protein J6U30_08690, partial [Oscillospiraceae bacterium]|nr:hypothetical protein [Oscillospiraceae bacterium]